MEMCTFCQVVHGDLPSSLVFETDLVVALLDIHPITAGHTLVMPRRHVCAYTDLSHNELQHMALVGQGFASALKAGIPHCDGVSLSLADGLAAGQEVPHTHLHVIPRHAGDGFGWRFPEGYGRVADRAALDAMATTIRAAMNTILGDGERPPRHTPPN